jgi:phage-related protein
LEKAEINVRIRFFAVLDAVCDQWPSFTGGGYWEAMHGSMSGFYEIRIRHKSLHYRFFCKASENLLLVICCLRKRVGERFSPKEYESIREVFFKAVSARSLPLR